MKDTRMTPSPRPNTCLHKTDRGNPGRVEQANDSAAGPAVQASVGRGCLDDVRARGGVYTVPNSLRKKRRQRVADFRRDGGRLVRHR